MSRDFTLHLGLKHHQAGRLREAAAIYRRLLDDRPDDAQACHLLGAVFLQQGDTVAAISLMSSAIRIAPHEAHFHYNLGNAYKDQGNLAQALNCYAEAIALDPGFTDAHNNRGTTLKDLGRLDEAIEAYAAAIRSDPEFANGYKNLATVLNAVGRRDDALAAYRRTVELDPGNLSAQHMAAALGGETTDTAPAVYVRELFDGYAHHFDDHLVNDLGYTVPFAMAEALGRLYGRERRFNRVLDLGCGTGLVGVAIRDIAGELRGVDLSPRMVERAAAKGVYDFLTVDEVVAFLHRLDSRASGYDLVLAAELFICIGDLVPVFAGIAGVLRPDAVVAFSVEHLDTGTYVLVGTGRYQHGGDYIRGLAAANGLSVVLCEPVSIRKGEGGDVAGDLVVLHSAERWAAAEVQQPAATE